MASDPKYIDTSGEPQFRAFKDIGVSDNGRLIRIILLRGKNLEIEQPIQIAADLIDKMMPALLNVAGESDRRRNGSNTKHVYQIKEGSVGQSTEGGVVFDFILSTGQHYAFQMDRLGAKLILGALSQIVNKIENENGPIDIPHPQ
jgi:hypothetical protein